MKMKRVSTMLLLAVMAFTCFGAAAEGIDLSGMSTDELISLYQSVGAEIADRIGLTDANRIGQGDYLVGRDILPGYYDFVCLETKVFEGGNPNCDIYVYLDDEMIFWANRPNVGSHVTFNLEEGMVLKISGCSGTLTPISPAWVP